MVKYIYLLEKDIFEEMQFGHPNEAGRQRSSGQSQKWSLLLLLLLLLLLPSFIVSSARARLDSFYVKKTIFAKEIRFVFVAGLEGSGHHALGPFFNSSGHARPFSTAGRRRQDAVDVAFLDLTLFGENSTEEYNTIKIAERRV